MMDRRRTGDKPLSELMVALFIETRFHHLAYMSWFLHFYFDKILIFFFTLTGIEVLGITVESLPLSACEYFLQIFMWQIQLLQQLADWRVWVESSFSKHYDISQTL